MKKVIITLMIAAMMFVMCVMVAHGEEQYYALVALVIELDTNENVVYVEDFSHNVWSFEGCEDWAIGDIVGLVMDTMGTEIIYDDVVINVTYNGCIPLW